MTRITKSRKISKPTWQSLEQVGRLGLDHREESKWRAAPEDQEQNFKAIKLFQGRQCKASEYMPDMSKHIKPWIL